MGKQGKVLTACWEAALAAVQPEALVAHHLVSDGSALRIIRGNATVARLDQRRVFLIVAGKAAAGMQKVAVERLGSCLVGGIVAAPEKMRSTLPLVQTFIAGHPVPDAGSVAAGRAVWNLLSHTRTGDVVLLLLSGGASSLLALPALGLRLADQIVTTKLLLRSGAPIAAVNSVRKHLSKLKGGGLVRRAAPARVVGLLLSDVIGNYPAVIGSGPAAADQTTFEDARRVLVDFGIFDDVPARVRRRILAGCAGHVPETLKPGEMSVRNLVIGDIGVALDAAAAEARKHGYRARILTRSFRGEPKRAAGQIIHEVREAMRIEKSRLCFLAGGETTVTVRGSGRGGRNQEMALWLAKEIAGIRGVSVLSAGSDGVDGPTDMAGAFVDGETWAWAERAGVDLDTFLARNDSWGFFRRVGGSFRPGPTGTNVGDLVLILINPGSA